MGLNGFISKESYKYIPGREKTIGDLWDLPAKYNSLHCKIAKGRIL